MKFTKGHKRSKGRPKGALNKEHKQLREFIAMVIDNNREKFEEEINKLEGKDYINAISNLMEYATPKLQRSEVNQTVTEKTKHVFRIAGQEIPFDVSN